MDSGRIPPTSQELLAMRNMLLAAAEIHVDRVNAVDVNDEEVHMTMVWAVTKHVFVTNLDHEAEML